jgi:CrcB protein
MTAVLLVMLGGALGAPARYLVDLLVTSRHDGVFPWGTLTVNAVGSLVAGGAVAAVTGLGGPDWLLTLLVVGFCGALTTFSTFAFETVRLLQEGAGLEAGLNCLASVLVGLVACLGGFTLVSLLVPG